MANDVRLENVRPDAEIQLWYGRYDVNCPMVYGEETAARLRGDQVWLRIEDEPHLSLLLALESGIFALATTGSPMLQRDDSAARHGIFHFASSSLHRQLSVAQTRCAAALCHGGSTFELSLAPCPSRSLQSLAWYITLP
jgi:hypothetical protein